MLITMNSPLFHETEQARIRNNGQRATVEQWIRMGANDRTTLLAYGGEHTELHGTWVPPVSSDERVAPHGLRTQTPDTRHAEAAREFFGLGARTPEAPTQATQRAGVTRNARGEIVTDQHAADLAEFDRRQDAINAINEKILAGMRGDVPRPTSGAQGNSVEAINDRLLAYSRGGR